MMWKKYQSIPLIYKMIAGMLAGIFCWLAHGGGDRTFCSPWQVFPDLSQMYCHAACHRKPHCGNLKPR